ncbi:hypothetical protein [Salinibacter ruber]|uniref:DinB/UmuC family translesion DNA polymerase n=1 Tax=Salinibacter ruber TaxID=146919 RepID=UPI002073FB97
MRRPNTCPQAQKLRLPKATTTKSYGHEASTRQTTLCRTVRSAEALVRLAERLLQRPHPPEEPAGLLGPGLLGLSVSSLTGRKEGGEQLELDFDQA